MYIDRIVSGVKIYGQEPEFKKSYLVAEGSPSEAICLIGELHVEAVNAGNLIEWLEPDNKDKYVLLISLDGKEGVVFPKSALEHRWNGEELYELDYGRHYSGEDLTAIIKDLDLWASKNTDIARDLGYKFNLKKIPKRLNFKAIRQDFAPGSMDREITALANNIEEATDDALVWQAIIDGNHFEDMDTSENVRNEIKSRIEMGISIGATFFPLTHVSLGEIEARVTRARRTLEKMRRMFPDYVHGNDEAIMEWAKTLKSDQLAEVAVLAYYTHAFSDHREKIIVMELQSRFPG